MKGAETISGTVDLLSLNLSDNQTKSKIDATINIIDLTSIKSFEEKNMTVKYLNNMTQL